MQKTRMSYRSTMELDKAKKKNSTNQRTNEAHTQIHLYEVEVDIILLPFCLTHTIPYSRSLLPVCRTQSLFLYVDQTEAPELDPLYWVLCNVAFCHFSAAAAV